MGMRMGVNTYSSTESPPPLLVGVGKGGRCVSLASMLRTYAYVCVYGRIDIRMFSYYSWLYISYLHIYVRVYSRVQSCIYDRVGFSCWYLKFIHAQTRCI